MNTEKLFSYGTLQYETVQLANFGRTLEGNKDQLPGYELAMLEITDPDVIATSGEAFHPIISYTGNSANCVDGMVFDISEEELRCADSYEVADYKRIKVMLSSGISAWVYVNTVTEVAE
ncbi:gamma-glutamylcyclotransferase family protein [Legionella dresdenensis]|uniref:Gamma-glutamylcyclotransferase family protein n=1 Tax=Legionella dresdenensis TaxID=450200 RepID=A0ABV8CGU9_9GAMM